MRAPPFFRNPLKDFASSALMCQLWVSPPDCEGELLLGFEPARYMEAMSECDAPPCMALSAGACVMEAAGFITVSFFIAWIKPSVLLVARSPKPAMVPPVWNCTADLVTY